MLRLSTIAMGSLNAVLVFTMASCGRSALDDDEVPLHNSIADAGVDADGGGKRRDAAPAPIPSCLPRGEACAVASQCCIGPCAAGVCLSPLPPPCKPIGATCSTASECCSDVACWGGICGGRPPPPPCKPAGASCGSQFECCNGMPCIGGLCGGGPPPLCKADGTACSSPSECCAGQCNAFVCGGPFACPTAPTPCGSCMAGSCCQEVGVCLLEAECAASWQCFNDCRAHSSPWRCANDCLDQPPTQAENNVYACGFQKCSNSCQ